MRSIGVAVFKRFSVSVRSVLLGTTALMLALSPMACDKVAKQATEMKQKAVTKLAEKAGVDVTNLTFWPPSSAGNYLAGRVAIANDDLETANTSFKQAIEAAPDGAMAAYLAERALPVAIGTGDISGALALSKALPSLEQSATGQFAVLLQLREAMDTKNWEQAGLLIAKIRPEGFGQFIKPLANAWLLAGQAKYKPAVDSLDQAIAKNPSLRTLFVMHRALILEMASQTADAEKIYRDMLNSSFSLGGALIAADFFARHDNQEALNGIYNLLHTKLALPVSKDNFIASFPISKQPLDAAHGYALSLLDLATVLHSENSSRLALLYARIAEPDMTNYPNLHILLGDIFSDMHDYDQARAAYGLIGHDTLFYPTAQWNIADTYILQNNTDAALKALDPITAIPALKRQALTQQADLLRADKQYDRAITLYTQVINDLGTPDKKDWGLYYARAICYESNKNFDKSEADLETALKISPDQSEVLNYLGYSWADKGVKLDQAYDYIARAHQQTPDDPYITDSAGWVLYQLGYFSKAVTFLEQSVQQLPVDATINDHLGDAYWQVGREHEARFQWERALKNADDQDKDAAVKLADKLKNGLPKKQAHNGPLPEVKTSRSNIDNLLQRLTAPIGAQTAEEPNMTRAPSPVRKQQ